MAMAVDAARQDQLGARVEFARTGPERAAERHDGAVLDADIASCRIGGGRYGAVADHEIIFGHGSSSYWPMMLSRSRQVHGRGEADPVAARAAHLARVKAGERGARMAVRRGGLRFTKHFGRCLSQ